MINVKTWDELDNVLMDVVEDSMDDIGEKVKDILKKYLQRFWYGKSTPQFYQRTMDVLNSITVGKTQRTKNEVEIEIYFDENKIRSTRSSFSILPSMRRFNHHMSVNGNKTYNETDISILIVYWMNYGQNSKLHSYDGAQFLEKTLQELNVKKSHLKVLSKSFRSAGLKPTILL